MAFSAYSLGLVKQWAAMKPKGARIVCLGYPDMLVAPVDLGRILDCAHDIVPVRADSASILAWHGLQGNQVMGGMVAESDWVLRRLGLDPTYVDVHEARGGEFRQDLNFVLHPDLAERFDIVYDAGTLEHCFNVAGAVANVLAMAKVGGFIYHGNPHNVGNHGFFNFCPTFYHDFYTQNGHELITPGCEVLLDGAPVGVLPSVGRYRLTLERETWLMARVVKKHDRAAVWPTQTKYIENPNLAGDGRLN